MMEEIVKLIIASVFSSSVFAALISVIFKKKTEEIAAIFKEKTERVTAEIKNQFETLSMTQKSNRAWKERAVAELYGPLHFQFARTENALKRYGKKNIDLETEILKDCNLKIRNLLLEKAYLITPTLTTDAEELINHYDVWLEKFRELRENPATKNDEAFIFVAQDGHAFPRKSEENFKMKYLELWRQLYEE